MKGSDKKVSYYRTCEHCGSHLDPGEICECRSRNETYLHNTAAKMRNGKNGQEHDGFKRNTAVAV